jgi:lipopolysaccharide transport system permease protein
MAAIKDVITTLWQHHALVGEMIWRELQNRVRGSIGGLLWPVLQPLVMLLIFAFVFGTILKVRWTRAESTAEFALTLFAGLLVFNLFAECLQRAPTLVLSRPNLVKKIVFPVEILSWVHVGQAFITFSIGAIILVLFQLFVRGTVPWTACLVPLVVLPVIFVGLGVGWLLGALTVFVRDVEQIVAPLSMALLFLTPVFFDLSLVPDAYRGWFLANPLTAAVEQTRAVLLDGVVPSTAMLAAGTAIAYGFAAMSLAFFRRARPEFADVM